MSIYAKIENGVVINTIICDDNNINSLTGEYIKQTNETNIAEIGFPYNYEKNKFESPKPYPSWILKDDLTWESPAGPKPAGISRWDEENQEWDIIVPAE